MRVNSSGDMLALVAELNGRRIAMVCGKMAKRQGGKLDLPRAVLDKLGMARRLHHRYMSGNYQHEPSEADKLRDLCQWLVDQHRLLNGDTESKPIQWDGMAMISKRPCEPRTYEALGIKLHDGEIDDLVQGGEEDEG